MGGKHQTHLSTRSQEDETSLDIERVNLRGPTVSQRMRDIEEPTEQKLKETVEREQGSGAIAFSGRGAIALADCRKEYTTDVREEYRC